MKKDYLYFDDTGKRLFTVHRDVGKKFYRTYWGDDQCLLESKPENFPESYPPYLQHTWDDSGPIFFVEGEKAADALRGIGLNATTTGGAQSWKPFFAKYFHKRVVYILPDNDSPGQEYAKTVANELSLDPTNIVKIVTIPDLNHKEDVYDYFERGGTLEELIELCEKSARVKNQVLLRVMSANEILNSDIKEPEWLVDGLIPQDGTLLISASPKVGKTRFARFLAAQIVDGNLFLGRKTIKSRVLFLAFEDSPPFTKKALSELPGLKNADDLFFVIGANPFRKNFENDVLVWLNFYRPHLIICDTLVKSLPFKDTNDYTHAQEIMEKLNCLRDLYPVSICLIHHRNKGEAGGINSVSGSTAITGAVDCIVNLEKNDDTITMQVTGRFSSDWPKTELVACPDGTFTLGDSIQESSSQLVENKILHFLNESPNDWVSQKDMVETLSLRKSAISSSLKTLQEKKMIEVRKIGRLNEIRLIDQPERHNVTVPGSPP